MGVFSVVAMRGVNWECFILIIDFLVVGPSWVDPFVIGPVIVMVWSQGRVFLIFSPAMVVLLLLVNSLLKELVLIIFTVVL